LVPCVFMDFNWLDKIISAAAMSTTKSRESFPSAVLLANRA
jgi:hypothetical protein